MKNPKYRPKTKKLGKETKKTKKLKEEEFLDQEVRLNKFIADAGVTSRRKADDLIAEGRVKVNEKTVTELGTKVKKGAFVTIDGDPIGLKENHVYYLLNKPKDTISTTDDELDRDTVLQIVNTTTRIYPVGRLDRNTTGVLLLTNDGELAHRLMHPSYEVFRTYKVKLDKKLRKEDAHSIANGGVDIGGEVTAPCDILMDPKDNRELSITLIEGKNREIRRVFEKFGYEVKKLDRKYFGPISNSGLARGEYRHLTRREVNDLKKLVGLI